MMRDPYGYPPKVARRYGDVVRMPLPGPPVIYLGHPDLVDHVTNRGADAYAAKPQSLKDAVADPPTFSYFSFTLDGNPWQRMRRLLRPAFSPKGIACVGGGIVEEVQGQVDSWGQWVGSERYVDLQPHFSRLTMSVFLNCFLGIPTEPHEVEEAVEVFDDLMQTFGWRILMGQAPAWMPRPAARKGRAANRWIETYVDAAIAARRLQPADPPTIFDLLLELRHEDGSPLTESELRGELRGLIVAGYETTAAVLSWTLAFLTVDQGSMARARAEVDEVVGDDGLRYQDLPQLTWLRACFDEAQRLQGHPFNGREAIEDDVVGGYLVPRGATVSFSAYALHRDPRFWRDAERFDPTRFGEGIDKHVFAPFGMGPHRCLGIHVAYAVGVLALAAALRAYDFESPPGYRPRHKYAFGNPVRDGVPVRLRRR